MKAVLSLLLLLLPPGLATAAAAGDAPVEGRDYTVVESSPWKPLDGKIEVVEIFAYTCPHCAEFEPTLEAWVRKLPDDVRFQPLPAAYDSADPFAGAFFVAEQAGVLPDAHAAIFDAVHHQGLLARNATAGELAWFLGQHGMDQARARAAMASPQVDEQMRHARAFALGIHLAGTPTLVVNGRYVVTPRTFEGALHTVDQLIAHIRSTR